MDERPDEHRLRRMLRDAVEDAPEPSFTVDDVTNASRRITARRRSLVTAAAAVVVGAGAVTGLVAFGAGQRDGGSTALAPGETVVSGEIAKKKSGEWATERRRGAWTGCRELPRRFAEAGRRIVGGRRPSGRRHPRVPIG